MRNSDAAQLRRAGLPPGCEAYRSTPVFTVATIPPGLLRSHRTAPGVWALIRVLEGRLLYRVLDPLSERILEASGTPGLVQPGAAHEVAPIGPVRFQVEFHRIAGRGSNVAATAASPGPERQARQPT